MPTAFDPRTVPDSFYDEQIKRLAVRLQTEMDAVAKTEEELRWWQEGRRIFVEEIAGDGIGFATDANEITPPSVVLDAPGTKVTTRQAVLRVLMESPKAQMRASEITAEIDRLGWSPGGQYWKNSIRNKIRELVDAGDLVKVDTGIYALTDAARAREGIAAAPVTEAPAETASPPSSLARGAVSNTVLDVVRRQGVHQSLRPAEIRQILGSLGIEADSNAVRVALRRWADRGEIRKHDDGSYSALPVTDYIAAAQNGMPAPERRESFERNGPTLIPRDPGEI